MGLQALQQAAAASGHLQPGEMPAGMHGAQVDAAGQVQGHLHGQLDPQMAGQAQVNLFALLPQHPLVLQGEVMRDHVASFSCIRSA